MKKYRIEEYLNNVENIDISVKKLFKELKLNYILINSHITRYEYNNSDFTAWVLFYGEGKVKEIKEDSIKLLNLKVADKSIFNTSGNGFGTGLSILANLSTKYD